MRLASVTLLLGGFGEVLISPCLSVLASLPVSHSFSFSFHPPHPILLHSVSYLMNALLSTDFIPSHFIWIEQKSSL